LIDPVIVFKQMLIDQELQTEIELKEDSESNEMKQLPNQ